MGKSVVILKGSPRENGNSSVLADQVKRGAESKDADVESFILQKMNIRPCTACDICRKERGCAVKDDMAVLVPKLIDAEAVVLASPIYWFTYSSQLKTCIDRWYGLWNQNPHAFEGKKIGIVLTYGDDDFYRSGAINAIHTFESMFKFLHSEIVGMVYGSALDIGDAEKDGQLMDQAYRLGLQLVK